MSGKEFVETLQVTSLALQMFLEHSTRDRKSYRNRLVGIFSAYVLFVVALITLCVTNHLSFVLAIFGMFVGFVVYSFCLRQIPMTIKLTMKSIEREIQTIQKWSNQINQLVNPGLPNVHVSDSEIREHLRLLLSTTDSFSWWETLIRKYVPNLDNLTFEMAMELERKFHNDE
jgi:hypothetical protein